MRMKRTFITLILLVLTALTCSKTFSQPFNAGLIAGATISQVDGDTYYGYNQLGWTAGAYVNLPVSEHFAAQAELRYSLMGAHSSVKEVTEYYYSPYNLRLHYVEIPLMMRYDFGHFTISGKSLDFISLEAGVSLDLRMKATEDVDGDYQVTTSRWNFFSMTGNVGAHFAITDHFGVGVRWMYSIMPIRFTGNPGWFYNQYYNKAWQAVITYNLNSPVR